MGSAEYWNNTGTPHILAEYKEMARCVFFSPFQREECRRRIEGATEPDTLFTMIKLGTGVVARLSDTGFRLRMRRALPRYGLEHLASLLSKLDRILGLSALELFAECARRC